MNKDAIRQDIFSLANQIEEIGGILDSANLRRGAMIFYMKNDIIMLQRTLETARRWLNKWKNPVEKCNVDWSTLKSKDEKMYEAMGGDV